MPQVIEVVQSQAPVQPSLSLWGMFLKTLPYVLVIILILAGLLFLLWYIMKKLKDDKNVFIQLKKSRISLCKIHGDKRRGKFHLLFRSVRKKNQPIKIQYMAGTRLVSKIIGYYRGHYYSNEGNLMLFFYCQTKWLVLPKPDILVINKNAEMSYFVLKDRKDGKGEQVRERLTEQLPTDLDQWTENEIILFALGVDKDARTGFFFPVIKGNDGKIISMAFPTYQSLKNVILTSELYEQTDAFARVVRKAVDMSPSIKAYQKTADSSQTVESR